MDSFKYAACLNEWDTWARHHTQVLRERGEGAAWIRRERGKCGGEGRPHGHATLHRCLGGAEGVRGGEGMRGGRLDMQAGAEARGIARPNLFIEAGCRLPFVASVAPPPPHLVTLCTPHFCSWTCAHTWSSSSASPRAAGRSISTRSCAEEGTYRCGEVWGSSEGEGAGLGRQGDVQVWTGGPVSHTFPEPSHLALLLPGCPLCSRLAPHLSLPPLRPFSPP